MAEKLPKDAAMLLSYVNTQLRDFYPSLDELCRALPADKAEIIKTLLTIDYEYDAQKNQFV